MNPVWNAPEVFTAFACRQSGSFKAFSCSCMTASRLPAQVKPLGKREFATWQMSVPLVFDSSQSLSTVRLSRPATDTIICGEASAASCMASPRSCTSFRPVSKSKTPAAASAVYSPSEKPATAFLRATTSGLVRLSSSRAARPPMYIAGWQIFVCWRRSSGPLRQMLRMSKPRRLLALSVMAFTIGRSFTFSSILTYWEPWPGKSRATGKGGPAGATS
mmetsp:Transcript_99141/g.276080  ORF Transcript_99141/g.276080 Transcript_99141/m.276080 type:complete len:218 (-) Transcript_99141:1240-1893(-)